jgi:ankyrin repeat protein
LLRQSMKSQYLKRVLTSITLVCCLTLAVSMAGCSEEPSSDSQPAKPAAQMPSMEAAMLVAAAAGDNAKVKELLDKGVSVNMLGRDHNTPLMEAAYAGHLNTVKLLLDNGADLSAKKSDGATPMALAGAHKDVFDLFKSVNALVEAAGKGNNQSVKELIDKGTPINALDQFGHSALTEACWNGKTETVKLLLEKGADPTIKKSDGATPLNLAAGQKHEDIVVLLTAALAKRSGGGTQPVTKEAAP